jgi:intracellular septation protein A
VAQAAAKAAPNLLLLAVAPAVCFLLGRHFWGLGGAVGFALGWAGVCQGYRWLEGRRVSGLLVVCLFELVVRGSVALVFGSAELYFVASVVLTALTALIYLGCPSMSKRLIALVISDLLPGPVVVPTDPRLARLLRKISVAYGIEQLVVALLSLIMVLNLSVTAYVTTHVAVSWLVLAVATAVAYPWLRGELRAVLGYNKPILPFA